MAIQNFFTSRDNNANANTYVGQQDRLWYNIGQNALYVSDGVTPGGIPVGTGPGVDIVANNISVNTISNDDSTEVKFLSDVTFDDEVSVNGNLTIAGNISPASNVKIGGVRAGPGANISNTGLLTIDTTGLPLSFGNFTANNNILTIVNADENMILATQGSAEIQLVGNIGFYKTNGLPPDVSNRYFYAQDDGQIQILVPNTDPLLGAVEIIGSATGISVSPAIAGVMLHITGQPNIASSIYNDGIGTNPNYIGRRYNGSAASPTQVLAGNTIVRFSGQGYSTGGFNAPADGTISLDALEDFTQTNQGAIWRFLVNPVGGNVRQEVANISVADGVTATKFTTAGTVSATGNITGGNLITGGVVSATGNITGGNLSGTAITGTLATAAQPNVTSVGTLSSLTVTGNVSGGNLITGGVVSATGNITGGNLSGTLITGTLSTAAQPNVTSVGTLTSLTVTGNVSGGNLTTGAQVVATGNISGANITATANIADSKGDVRSIPVNTQNTGYTLQASDAGKVINMTTGNVTVPAGVFASPFGQAITIYNDQNASNAVVSGAGVTLRLAGTAATGNRTLARYGLATVVCVSANTFVISGAGLT